MHITNQKLSFDKFTVRNLQNIFMEHELYLKRHKTKIDDFDPYSVFLAIATNIPQRLKTAFVLQGHIYATADCTIMFLFCFRQIKEKMERNYSNVGH